MRTRPRTWIVLSAAVAAVLLLPAAAAATTYTGSVTAGGDDWSAHTFTVSAAGTLQATLTWSTPSARLSLALSRRNADGSWTWVKGMRGSQPLRLGAAVTTGSWRLRVKALSGSSAYTLVANVTATPPPAGTRPYLTIMMGRAIQSMTLDARCQQPTPLSKTLADVADELWRRGLRATAPITLSEIDQTQHTCVGGLLYASWSELEHLRDVDGWDVVPRGPTNDVVTGLTGQPLWDATCGLLPTFVAHGFNEAWGLYAYPQNRWTQANQLTVKTCYAYGRQYAGLGVTNPMPIHDPYWLQTVSVNGGRCNDSTLPCYTDANVKNGRRYMLPSQLDTTVSTRPDSWTAIQFYRFVTGSYGTASSPTANPAWDCTSADPRRHWSHQPETYCWDDFVAFLTGLPSVIDASPGQVAQAYDRVP